MTRCTVRDRSEPKTNVETWHIFYGGKHRVGLAVQPLGVDSKWYQGAALPVREARRLIETIGRICDEIEENR